MIKPSRVVALGALASTLAFAASWSGSLVSLECYAEDKRNVTLKDWDVSHDRDFEVRQCAPNK